MTDREFMELALIEAEKAYNEGEIPIGAVVVYDGVVVAMAHNEKEQSHDPTAHAEVLALRKAASRPVAFDRVYSLCYYRAMPNVRRRTA